MVKKKSRRNVKKGGGGKIVSPAGDFVAAETSLVSEKCACNDGDSTEFTSCSRCPHVALCQSLRSSDVRLARQKDRCDACGELDKRLWFCLSDSCGLSFCGSRAKNHSDEHFKQNQSHSLQLNLRSGRVWCLLCDCEVFLYSNIPPFTLSVLAAISKNPSSKNEIRAEATSSDVMAIIPKRKDAIAKARSTRTLLPIRGRIFNDHGETRRVVVVDSDDDDIESAFPRGLTGLCNLGNTCYMNAALQSLSNCSPLAEYFRSASSMAPFASHCLSRTFEPPLSRAFRLLLQTIWSRSRSGYTSPQLLLNQMRIHCPQFRGWGQQDSQEFIRCFLDLIHRELRQPVYSWEHRDERALTKLNKTEDSSSLSSLKSLSNSAASTQKPTELRLPPVRRNSSSSSSSRCSNSVDRYETADSGWSSDGDTCNASTSVAVSSLRERKRCRSMSPKALERLSVRDPVAPDGQSRKEWNFLLNDTTEAPKTYRSIVNDVFDGQLRSTVKCFTCQHISETYETFQDLSLCIPTREQLERLGSTAFNKEDCFEDGAISADSSSNKSWLWWLGIGWLWSFYGYIFSSSITLVDALNAFFSPDDLRDENMYSCEKCAKLRNGVKMCKITRLPEVLCIHLKRFRHDSFYSTKVSTNVSFPLCDLDLSPFLSSSSDSSATLALYDLCAFITHHGNSAESGHYLAYCKNEFDNNWYEFDDTVVTKLEPADVLTKEAYVLFYQRKSTEKMEKIKSTVRLLFEEHKSGKKKFGLPHYYISREWLHRLSTFSHPGPITNYDFLCRHVQILPRKALDLVEHYAVVECATWEYLLKEFGGGPVCTELHYCPQCQSEYQWLQHKRDHEVKTFKAIENRTREAATVFPALTYSYYLPPNAISKSWLLKWRSFVDGESLVPPGPIDNRSLLVRSTNDSLIYVTRSTNIVELPRELWLFFHSVYGGGPEVFSVSEPHPTEEETSKLVAAVEPKMKEAVALLKARQETGLSNKAEDFCSNFEEGFYKSVKESSINHDYSEPQRGLMI